MELMVAILVSAIVLAGVYSLYTTSARGYRLQNQTIGALGQLRMGLRQVRADVRSAAYHAPAQSNEEPWVDASVPGVLTAFTMQPDPDGPVHLPGFNTNIEPQQLTLLGDFWGQETYETQGISGQDVTLSSDSVSDLNQDDFERIFRTTRFLRLVPYGRAATEQIIPIDSRAWNGGVNPTIGLEEGVDGVQGLGSGYQVSVLGYVRYRLMQDTRDEGDESPKFDLIRQELDEQRNPVGGALVVAERVVDMRLYDFCLNVTPPSPGSTTMEQTPVDIECYEDPAALQDAGYSLAPGAGNDSHLLRSVTLKLAARTAEEDPDRLFAPRDTRDEPLRSYELNQDAQGAARVFEMAATVTTTSIQARRR